MCGGGENRCDQKVDASTVERTVTKRGIEERNLSKMEIGLSAYMYWVSVTQVIPNYQCA